MDLNNAYRVLDVPVGASRELAREAKLDLQRLLHPDHHQKSDDRLKRKAEEKSKQINQAYDVIEKAGFPTAEQVRLHGPATPARPHPQNTPRPSSDTAPQRPRASAPPPQQSPPGAPPNGSPPPWTTRPPDQEAPGPTPTPSADQNHKGSPTPSMNGGVHVLYALAAVISALVVWAIHDYTQRSTPQSLSTSEFPTRSYDFHESPRHGPTPGVPEVNNPDTDRGTAESVWRPGQPHEKPPEVIDSQNADPGASATPPTHRADGSSFTIGSTKEEVLSIQGTPSSINGDTWTYELSRVSFNNDRVESYSNISNNLQLSTPTLHAAAGSGFTIGSTKQEVLSIQGTPSSINGDTWTYELSRVSFNNDRVESYSNISKNLRLGTPPQRADR